MFADLTIVVGERGRWLARAAAMMWGFRQGLGPDDEPFLESMLASEPHPYVKRQAEELRPAPLRRERSPRSAVPAGAAESLPRPARRSTHR